MWDKIKRNEDGTYSVSGSTGKIRATLIDLLSPKEISKKELLDLIMKMPIDGDISIIDFVMIEQIL
jgi:hypothetical protein